MSENDVKKIFARNINRLRKNRNLTQQELAESLELGKTTVSQWESAQKLPNAASIEKISLFFQIPSSALFEEGNGQYVSLERLVHVPVAGKVSCGNGTMVIEEIEAYEATPEQWLQGGSYFYLRAQGDSMINARISDGDLLLLREQREIENGEIAAVLINDKLYLKRVYIQEGTMVLQSENSDYSPIVVSSDDSTTIFILGKLKKVIINF